MKTNSLVIILIFLFSSCSKINRTPPIIKQGILDLKQWNLSVDGYVPLNGEWEFYYEKLYDPDFFENNQMNEIKYLYSPSSWHSSGYPLYGYATYRIKILNIEKNKIYSFKLPHMNSSYKLYVNKKLIATNGVVSTTKELSIPQYLPMMVSFFSEESEIEIILQISNFYDNISGIWDSIFFGTHEQMLRKYWTSIGLEIFYLAIILIMGFYHLFLFFFRNLEKSSLFFGLFCLDIAIRTVLIGEKLLLQIIPNLNWNFQIKLEYLTVYFAMPLFGYFIFFNFFSVEYNIKYKFLINNFSWENVKKYYIFYIINIISLLSIAFIIITIFTEIFIYGKFISYYQIIILLGIIFYYYILITALIRKKEGAIFSLVGTIALVIATINDILYSKKMIHTAYLLPFGFFIFILFQSLSLAYKFSMAFFRIEDLTKKLGNLIQAFEKFVPKEFLQILNKEDITQIQLCDQVQKEMTIMFLDIQNFTNISEKLTPEENFKFINLFFQEIEPIIKKYDGFIDKYLGDGLMAIFPKSGDTAIKCAIEIQEKLRNINIKEIVHINRLKVRIGIHSGLLMLGVVGSMHRFENTVISDVVNTASRLEKINKEFQTDIVVSENLLNKTIDLKSINHRYLGNIKLKGKDYPIKIYEIYNHYPSEIIELYESTKEQFVLGIEYFSTNQVEKAYNIFIEILSKNPDDTVSNYYCEQCRTILGL